MKASCPDCRWTMEADDADEAQDLLGVHDLVHLEDQLRGE